MAVWRIPVNLTWDDPGSPGVNVWHVRTATEVAEQGELQEALDSIDQFYAGLLTSGASPFRTGLVMRADVAYNVADDSVRELNPVLQRNQGTNGTDAPMALCICVGWTTSSRTRRGRGRTFLGPLATACIDDDGTIIAQRLAAVNTQATALAARNAVNNDWAVGIWGLQNAGGGPESPHVLRDITGSKVRDTFAVLRSRRD